MLLPFTQPNLCLGASGMSQDDPAPSESPVRVAVELAMRRLGRFSFRRIEVLEANGEVTLQGDVRTWFQKQLAQHTAMQVPGVRRVVNTLRVDDRSVGGMN